MNYMNQTVIPHGKNKRGVEKWLTPYLTNYSMHGPCILLGQEIAIHHTYLVRSRMRVSAMHLSINACSQNHHQTEAKAKSQAASPNRIEKKITWQQYTATHTQTYCMYFQHISDLALKHQDPDIWNLLIRLYFKWIKIYI